MKKISLIFLVLTASFSIYSESGSIITAGFSPFPTAFFGSGNPHDSLLFDGGTMPSIDRIGFYEDVQCYTKVMEVTGTVIGKVLKKEIVAACGENETLYTTEERFLKKGDKLMHGSEVVTSVDSKIELGIYMMETGFSSIYIKVGPESRMTTPDFVASCKVRLKEQEQLPPEEIKVIQGIITYDAPPAAEFKAKTKSKRSSVKHTKTRYSHEVKFNSTDTIDVIRVYEGSVEVTMENIDTNEGEMTKKMEQWGKDMQSGKITAEELQARMTEFQNYGQNLNELMTPLNVDEGFKCTVTKNSRIVEPLGAGDEDKTK